MFKDDIFDKRFIDELYQLLINGTWKATNSANNYTWPYGEKGTHVLLGETIFIPLNKYQQRSSKTLEEQKIFLDTFDHLCKVFNDKLRLDEISTNLQFCGMDGSVHVDGLKNQIVYILMLSNNDLPNDIGGEFINTSTNSKFNFKHGRVIKLNAADKHQGLAFNKPNIPRISVKFMGSTLE